MELITFKEALKLSGVSQPEFYKLRNENLISDGTQERVNTIKLWDKKLLLCELKKIRGFRPDTAECGFNLAMNLMNKT